MSQFELFRDESGLPRTTRGALPYEIEALSPRETWGHGHGSTALNCRQKWNDSATWIRYMVGEVAIRSASSVSVVPQFIRHIPEKLQYGDGRLQWCTGVSQIDQGGNPVEDGEDPQYSTERFADEISNWPRTAWCRYQTLFETTPYWIRDDNEIIDMISAGGANAGASELLRYVVRDRRTYAKEQPIPAATSAGGFRVIDDATPANRLKIGQVGFRVISMADVSYRHIRIPIGWPPPPGWQITDPANPWPPLVNPTVNAPSVTRRLRESRIGYINSTVFDCCAPEGYSFQTGELLYTGFSEFPYWDAAGFPVTDIQYNFRFKEGGWNFFLDARGTWKEVSADSVVGDNTAGTSGGRKPYQSFDFNDLFRYSA